MLLPTLKEEVIKLVSSIKDNHLLELVKADIEYFEDKETDILDKLNVAEREELLSLVNEPDEKDTLTEEEYKAATAKWHTNLILL